MVEYRYKTKSQPMWKTEKASVKTLGTLLIEDPLSSFSFVWNVHEAESAFKTNDSP